jgi:alpha-glucosidase
MPWTDADPKAGFSTGKPWLPIPNDHIRDCVAAQHVVARSTLNYVRRLLHWRKNEPAMVSGDIAFLETRERQIAFLRTTEDRAADDVLVAVNLADSHARLDRPEGELRPVEDLSLGGRIEADALVLPPHEALIARVAR